MFDLIFLAIAIPLAILTAAVGRTVIMGPQYKVEKATTKWLLNVVLLVVLLAFAAGVAMLRASMKGPPTAFEVLDQQAAEMGF